MKNNFPSIKLVIILFYQSNGISKQQAKNYSMLDDEREIAYGFLFDFFGV